ncbi:cyclic nucleotide-binding domain-containing protein [Rhodanobacter aciditrophus]|uniref:Cyclic nucleotide-binding domain-containing protein n=1 Tax=Rhodanobacter aciditrophus TaxID=1623218 RepID=A0ABW4B2P1_9GAMM
MNTIQISQCVEDITPERLKTGSIFGALSPSGIQYLVNEGELLHFSKGESVFENEDKGDFFYIVITGEVAFYKKHSTNATLIRRVSFGEALGYVTMISLTQRLGNARAEKDAILLKVDYNLFAAFHDKHAFDFGILILNLSRDMARNIQKLSNTIAVANIDVDLTF